MEFSRPEYWSREPFPSPGDLPGLGIEPRSPGAPKEVDLLLWPLQGHPPHFPQSWGQLRSLCSQGGALGSPALS